MPPEHEKSCGDMVLALIAVVAVIVVAFAVCPPCGSKAGFTSCSPTVWGYPYSCSIPGDPSRSSPETGIYGPMYSSVEVDPLITGQYYARARNAGENRRLLYGNRVAHSGELGLREFSSGLPGEVGVDVGPLGLREYSLGGQGPEIFDDGIPENWYLPSTPVKWYAPKGEDYYDVEASGPRLGPDVDYSLMEPDHDPLLN